MAESLTSRLAKIASKASNRTVNVLSNSGFINKEVLVKLPIPALNLAHSGRFDGGLTYGSHQIVGESKTFKTLFGIIQCKAFQDVYPEGTVIFLDAEFGANEKYWLSCGIDMNRVIHIPVANVEEYSNMVITLLEQLGDDDKVIFFTDSVGQLGSRKELQNTLEDEANKQDFTRAKSLNSFWRLSVPLINLHKVPFIWIGGVYDTMDKYDPVAVSGGKKGYLGADNIWYVARSKFKEKVAGTNDDGKATNKEEQTGHIFTIKVIKGRFVRENAAIPVCVRNNGGIDKYFGILEIARAVGAVEMPRSGWYCRSENIGYVDDKQLSKNQMTPEWYESLLGNSDFQDLVGKAYQLSSENLLGQAAIPSFEEIQE